MKHLMKLSKWIHTSDKDSQTALITKHNLNQHAAGPGQDQDQDGTKCAEDERSSEPTTPVVHI